MTNGRNDTRVSNAIEAVSLPWAELEAFGPYRLAGLIARGGMAELYLAIRDQHSFRQVLALKRVLPGVGDPEVFNRMFAQEAALTVRLEHPNIVRVYDFGEVDGQAYLAMEYLPGEDLERILRRYSSAGTRMPLRIAAEIARSMAAGLGHAHGLSDDQGQSLHLVHRDVTPSNVMVTYQGITKLVDFGIAKARSNTLKTSAGAIKGKLAYLAPEAFTNHSAVDARSDVYSAGCVLWEMMVGARPFEAPNDAALMANIVHGSLPDVREVAPDVDDALAAICMKALAREPHDRFASAGSLEEELEAYLDANGGRLGNKQIAQWMTGLFGPELASAKLDVASGTRLVTALPQILTYSSRSTPAGRSRVGFEERVTPSLKSTGSASLTSATSLAATAEHQLQPWVSRVVVAALIAAVVGVTGAGLWLMAAADAPASASAHEPPGELVVESNPPGAAVFVDGSPLGRVTPTTLSRLRPGQALIVGVQLSGYEANERRVVPGERRAVERFSLSPRRGKP